MSQQKIRIRLKSYDYRILDQYCQQIIQRVKQAKGEVAGPVLLPTKIARFTVLRSPHVDKKSREQFEIRIHKRIVDIINPTNDTVNMVGALELPSSVQVEIKTWF